MARSPFTKAAFALLTAFLSFSYAEAQDWLGYHSSNYAGIHAVNYNPAFLAGNNYKLDVSLIAGHIQVQNDFVGLDNQVIFEPTRTGADPDFNRQYLRFSDHTQFYSAFTNVHLQAPSVLWQFSPRDAIGFAPALRVFMNADHLDRRLARLAIEGLDYPPYWNYDQDNLYMRIDAHAYAEYALSYARTLYNDEGLVIKAGITGKVLQGISAAEFQGTGFTHSLQNMDTIDIRRFSGELYMSEGVANQAPGFRFEGGPSFGLDFGMIFEIHPGNYRKKGLVSQRNYVRKKGLLTEDETPYTARFGFSVSDIGSISYATDPRSAIFYINRDSIPLDEFNSIGSASDLGNFLETNYQGINSNDSSFSMLLPTTLRFFGDLRFIHNVGLHAGMQIGLFGGRSTRFKNAQLTQFNVTPRWEIKYFGAYMPFTIDEMGLFNWGISLRAGPLVIGTGDLLSNLAKGYVMGSSFHFGLRWVFPIINAPARNPGCNPYDRSYKGATYIRKKGTRKRR